MIIRKSPIRRAYKLQVYRVVVPIKLHRHLRIKARWRSKPLCSICILVKPCKLSLNDDWTYPSTCSRWCHSYIPIYADAIILVSESEEGLQNGLNVLSKFCSSWKLEVNTKKSKIMIFNSNGKSFLNHFKLDNEYLETVKSYCYLQN